LEISAAKYQAFKELLRELSESGKIERCQKNCYRIPDTGKQFSGMISFSSRGFAFVHTENDEEIFVGSYDTFTAFTGIRFLLRDSANRAVNDRKARSSKFWKDQKSQSLVP